MKSKLLLATALVLCVITAPAVTNELRWITLDPGHFHAALVQKSMYPQVNPVVHVYAPEGPDVDFHLKRIAGFNTRAENPTKWQEQVYTGPDFLDRMIRERAGNVVVISGNNARKAGYILRCVEAGLNVLADKPMVIKPAEFAVLEQACGEAERRHLLLRDMMPERYEITTILQRELSRMPEVFGTLQTGTLAAPAVTKENVHHYLKKVAGSPLIRPPWFFDVAQQGEGIVDVTTHLVDLIQWECFPEQVLHPKDVQVLAARSWATKITPGQFQQATGCGEYPDYLKVYAGRDNALEVPCNGAFNYTLRGVHARVSVEWRFEAPPGSGDTHYSIMRGTKAHLIIRQEQAQEFKPTLYVENHSGAGAAEFEKALRAGLAKVGALWPGVDAKKTATGWEILIPDRYKVGHEAHFAQVTENYLRHLAAQAQPAWEMPGLLTKYYTIMQACQLSHAPK
jgi:predicted dehydrogenase